MLLKIYVHTQFFDTDVCRPTVWCNKYLRRYRNSPWSCTPQNVRVENVVISGTSGKSALTCLETRLYRYSALLICEIMDAHLILVSLCSLQHENRMRVNYDYAESVMTELEMS